MKQLKNIKLFRLLLVAMAVITIVSCKKDDVDPGNGEEAETAFIRGINAYTPGGTINYVEVVKSLSAAVDLSKAIELGQNTRIYSVGDKPYTINSGAKTITKWNVNKTTLNLSVDAILSYASTGSNSTNVVFVSETSAFINDLIEGIIIEFNPSNMEITKTYNVTSLEVPSNFGAFYNGYAHNGKIVFPIRWQPVTCCDYPNPLYATVAVFDPATGSVTYNVDERSLAINSILYADGNSSVFLLPNSYNASINHFYNANQNIFSVFKLKADGSIDDSYEVDLTVGLPKMKLYNSSSFVYQDVAVFTYSEDEFTGSFANRTATQNAMTFKAVSYNLKTNEVKAFTAFANYARGVNRKAVIDGKGYFVAYNPSANTLDTDLLVQNGLEDFTVISSIKGGDFPYIEKLW
jgi:hypothetical protein